MRKTILGLFLILFCFSVSIADEQKDYKKALIEVFRSKGFLVEGFESFEVTTLEAMVRILVRQNLEEKGFKLVEPKKDLLNWLKKEEERLAVERLERKKEALLKKQEEENTKLQYLIWELENVKSDTRLELDFIQDYYLFMPLLYRNRWLYPSSKEYLSTTPDWASYFWLYYYRR